MKFIIFTFLAICAIQNSSANLEAIKVDLVKYNFVPTSQLHSNFGLAESINDFIKEKVDEANKFIEEFNKISENSLAESQQNVEDATKQVDEYFNKINKKIVELKQMGGIYKKCAENLEIQLKELRGDGLQSIINCITAVASSLKEFATEVTKEAAVLAKNVAQLVLLVKECYDKDGIISTAKCAFQNIKEVKELIPQIVSGIKSTVSVISTQAKAVIVAGNSCKQDQVNGVETKFISYDLKINQCYV